MESPVRQITIGLALFLGAVYCEPQSLNNQYGPPGNFLGGGGGGGGNNNNHQGGSSHGGGGGSSIINSYGSPLGESHNPDQDYIDSQPKSYEFGYAVKDTATGNDFGRSETSDGETVRGEYRVQLPDGRTQIVTYTADWRTGFHADVRYEGEATFPDQYTNNNANSNNNNNGFNNNANNNNNNGYNNNANNNNNNNGYNSNANKNYYNNNNGYNSNSNTNNNGYSNSNNNLGYNNNGGYNSNQGYNNYNRGNQGGYNYNANYNNGGNNYQYPSTNTNTIDNYSGGGYTGSGSFGPSGPSSTYGTPNFH